jgi:uncharacterized membrane protein
MMLAIALVKGLHIAGVILWAAGLIALPLMPASDALPITATPIY